jgi:hypothetical protein
MSWAAVMDIIAAEAGADVAARIEDRVRREVGAGTIYLRARVAITKTEVEEAAPGKPREAARKLGIHPATAYRVLKKTVLVR